MLLAAVVDYRVSACRNCLRKHKCIHVDNVLVCVCMCFDVKQSGGVVKKLGWSELSSRWYFSCLVITLTNEKVNVSIRKRGPREVETAKKQNKKTRNKTLVQVKARKPDITQVNQGRLLFHSISFLCQSMKTKMDRRTRREQTEEEREKIKERKQRMEKERGKSKIMTCRLFTHHHCNLKIERAKVMIVFQTNRTIINFVQGHFPFLKIHQNKPLSPPPKKKQHGPSGEYQQPHAFKRTTEKKRKKTKNENVKRKRKNWRRKSLTAAAI